MKAWLRSLVPDPASMSLVLTKLDQILSRISALEAQGVQRMTIDAATQAAIDNLNAKVAANTTVEGSVVTLLNGLSAQIKALGAGATDPAIAAAFNAAAAVVDANNTAMSAAVAANTPAAPAA